MTLLKAKAITKRFGEIDVLKGVDLDVKQGECVCIIGPSGSGKSTFLRCLNRLEDPTSGEVWLSNEEITGPKININEIRQKIGMVFQSFNLYPHLSVEANVMLALRKVQKKTKAEAHLIAHRALEHVGLGDKVKAMPQTLSGGQQQRAAIARAIALRPALMLFDEPTSALDPELVSSVSETMQTLRQEGMTMVVVTHEMRFARENADRVVFMVEGVEVANGSPSEIFDTPKHPRLAEFLKGIS